MDYTTITKTQKERIEKLQKLQDQIRANRKYTELIQMAEKKRFILIKN